MYNRVCSIAIGKLGGSAVVITGRGNGGVRVIDLLDGTRKLEFVPKGEEKKHAVIGVAITQLQGNPVVLAGYEDGTLRLIDMTSGKLIRKWHFYSHGQWTTIVSVTSCDTNGQTLVAAVTNHENMRFWHIADGVLANEIRDMDMDRPAAAFALIRNELDLPQLVTLSEPRYPGNCSTCVTASVLNGKPVVVSGHEDGAIYAWDLESHVPIWNRDALLGQRGLGAYVDSIAVCDFHGRPVIAAGGSPGMIGAWDLADGSVVVEPFLSHERHAVRGIAITELDGRTVMIAAGLDRRVRAWDSHEHVLLGEREIDTGFPFTPLAVGSPGGQVIIVSGTGDGLVDVWRPSGSAAQ